MDILKCEFTMLFLWYFFNDLMISVNLLLVYKQPQEKDINKYVYLLFFCFELIECNNFLGNLTPVTNVL